MSETEIVNKLRGLVRRVTVKDIKDDGQMQTASAEVAEGVWREDLEVMLPYGLVSVPDDDGAVGVALAIGGDEGDMVILPLANPSQRMGGWAKAMSASPTSSVIASSSRRAVALKCRPPAPSPLR